MTAIKRVVLAATVLAGFAAMAPQADAGVFVAPLDPVRRVAARRCCRPIRSPAAWRTDRFIGPIAAPYYGYGLRYGRVTTARAWSSAWASTNPLDRG